MVLLINNKTSFISSLEEWLKYTPFVVKEKNDDWGDMSMYDQIIISGGHEHEVVHHEDFYKKELDLIKNFQKTKTRLIGICLGFELIAHAFGSELKHLPEKKMGETDIRIVKNDPVFKNIKEMRVFESHRWSVGKLGDELEILAESEDGIEAIGHKKLPIYGFQFHPEIPKDSKNTSILLGNLLDI